MKKAYYREQALERIARDVITAYDLRLWTGHPHGERYLRHRHSG